MTRSVTLTLIGLAVLGVLVLIYINRAALSESLADMYSDGSCFICGRPLQSGDDIGSYLGDPARGLAHFACIERAEGPLSEVD